MAGKTMIDGVVYDITGGKTLIDGVAYNITEGKTLIDGVAYNIIFDSSVIVFQIGDSALRKGTLAGRGASISTTNGLVVTPTTAMSGYFNILLDFTAYSTLHIAGYMISTSQFVPSTRPKVGYGTDTTDSTFTASQTVPGYKKGTTPIAGLAREYSFDISNKTGEYYIKGFAQRGGNIEALYVTSIYFT